MANCNDLFKKFQEEISIPAKKKERMMTSKKGLRDRIRKDFKEKHPGYSPKFYVQGSDKMKTPIRTKDDICDLDDGVYFQGSLSQNERPKPQIFHDWVIRAVDKDNDYEQVKDKATCVRVQYKLGFHIDIPIYYAGNFDSPDLAETNKGWLLSNPVEFIAWFEEKTKSGFQKAYLYEALKYAEPYEKWLANNVIFRHISPCA